MIDGSAKVLDEDSVKLEITMRATVGEWRALMRAMDTKYPDWQFASMISSAIGATVARVQKVHELKP